MHTKSKDIAIAVAVALFVAFVIAAFIDSVAFGGAGQDALYGTGV